MRNLYSIFFLLLFGSIILLYLLLAFYNVLNAEDIELSAIPAITGINEFYWFFYDFVQGRYFTAVLHYLHPLSFNRFDLTWSAPVVGMVSVFLALYYFLRVAFKGLFSSKMFYLIAVVLLAYLFAASPSVPNLFYLTNAIVVYTIPAALMLLVWTVMIKAYFAKEEYLRIWWLAGAAALLFLLGGGGEVFFPVTILTALFGAWLFRKQIIGAVALPVSTIAGILIAYHSLGNQLDLESARGYEFTMPFLRGFFIKFLNEYAAILLSFFDLTLLFLTFFLITGSLYFFKKEAGDTSRSYFKEILYSLVLALFIPAPVYILCSFIIYDTSLIPRVVNCCLVLFIAWWSVFSLYLGASLWPVLIKRLKTRPLIVIAFFAGIATYILMIRTENVQLAFSDWKNGLHIKHYKEFLDRIASIQNIPAEVRCDTVIYIYPYTDFPESIHRYVDIYGDDASPSWNKAYEAYFGIKEVRALGDKGSKNLPAYRFKEFKKNQE